MEFVSGALTAASLLRKQAERCRLQGQPVEAVALLLRHPARLTDAELRWELNAAFQSLRDVAEAEEVLRMILNLAPEDTASVLEMGHRLAAAGQAASGITAYKHVLHQEPDRADAANNLGVLLRQQGEAAAAIRAYRLALAGDPQHADATYNLGRALLQIGEAEEAFLLLRRAAALRPEAERFHLLGAVCQARGDLPGAEAAYRCALQIQPNRTESINNLSNVLQSMGQREMALALLDQALGLAPADADMHFNRALLLLLMGRKAEGWQEYEWRWRASGFASPRRSFATPVWDGSSHSDATLLLHWEQGLGDTIQFARFVAAARARVGRVVLEVQPSLVEVLCGLAGADLVVAAGGLPPRHDYHLPLMSLPWVLGSEGDGLTPPYLSASSDQVAAWKQRLPADGPRVGLVWAGNPLHTNDRNRSVPLGILSPLLGIPGLRCVSLQVGSRAADIGAGGFGEQLTDLSSQLVSFADTAAVISALDLVISVDTAVAHLAGALGCEVWLLLPFAPDWRWGTEAEHASWYPRMSLFRQSRRGDWAEPVQRIITQILLQYQDEALRFRKRQET